MSLWPKFRRTPTDVRLASKAQLTQETEMIRGIRNLRETSAKEVMIPRVDGVFIANNVGKKELLQLVVESGHSRFPVYENTIDNIVGVLYAKDMLKFWATDKDFAVREVLRESYVVPESVKLDVLLAEFRRRKVHIAIVVDEYGGVAGLVCLEDVLEEIVGNIQDEFDNENEEIITVGQNSWICDARLSMEELIAALQIDTLNLDGVSVDCESVGGFVFNLLGRIPERYEKISYQNIDFIIQRMDGHRIRSIKVVLQPDESGEECPS